MQDREQLIESLYVNQSYQRQSFPLKYPALRILIPFVLGIYAVEFFHIKINLTLIWLFIGLAWLTSLFKSTKRLTVILVYISFFSVANYLHFKNNSLPKVNFGKHNYYLVIQPIDDAKYKSGLAIFPAKVLFYATDSAKLTKVKDKLNILVFAKTNQTINFGDLYLIKTKPTEVRNNGNPYEFDYKKFLARKHIYYKCFADSNNFQFLQHTWQFSLVKLSHQFRNYLLNLYNKDCLHT